MRIWALSLDRSLFTTMDFVLRLSIVPLFPYYSEGMVVQAKKQGQELSSE